MYCEHMDTTFDQAEFDRKLAAAAAKQAAKEARAALKRELALSLSGH